MLRVRLQAQRIREKWDSHLFVENRWLSRFLSRFLENYRVVIRRRISELLKSVPRFFQQFHKCLQRRGHVFSPTGEGVAEHRLQGGQRSECNPFEIRCATAFGTIVTPFPACREVKSEMITAPTGCEMGSANVCESQSTKNPGRKTRDGSWFFPLAETSRDSNGRQTKNQGRELVFSARGTKNQGRELVFSARGNKPRQQRSPSLTAAGLQPAERGRADGF